MKIINAKHSGFCFGVHRAVDMARDAAKRFGSVYTLGELIHNESVIEELLGEGIIPIESVDEVKNGSTVIIRSHGVAPYVYEKCRKKSINIIDATCPFVMRIHKIAEQNCGEGTNLIIAGKKDHPEVIGIAGRSRGSVRYVNSLEEAQELPHLESACLVAQTTFSSETFELIKEAVKERCDSLKVFNTICDTTRKRQEEAERLSKKCTAMVVIGGANSSNTEKLARICKKHCKKVQSIANTDELILEIIECNDKIGGVAGASTPQRMIMEVITRMSELEKTMAAEAEETTATVTEPTAAENAATNEEPIAEPETADSSFAEAFEKTLVRIRNGQLIKGSVVQIVDGEVCVNIGYKSDGFIPRSEFSHDETVDPNDVLKVGDVIEVEVLKVNDGEGNVLLSKKNVENKKLWETLIEDPEAESKTYDGIGKEAVKGGLIATINGVKAFVPVSQLAIKYVDKIEDYVKKPIKLKIIEIDKARKRIVASHKAVLVEEAAAAKKAKFEELKAGMKVKGVVRRLTDYGAFVDIGGIDGLIHVTDVAWGRGKTPADVLKVGQEIEVLILNVDANKERISLGYKQLQPKPWTMAAEKYPVGSIVEGKVVRIVDFGAFVALEPSIDGLIHISQISPRRAEKVEDELKVGDVVRCKVLEVNPEARRISLSRKDVILEENPELAQQIAKEREDRARMAAERAERRAQHEQNGKPQAASQRGERSERNNNAQQSERRERRERSNDSARQERAERPERTERRPRREDADYELPPLEQATPSLADLFSGFASEDDE